MVVWSNPALYAILSHTLVQAFVFIPIQVSCRMILFHINDFQFASHPSASIELNDSQGSVPEAAACVAAAVCGSSYREAARHMEASQAAPCREQSFPCLSGPPASHLRNAWSGRFPERVGHSALAYLAIVVSVLGSGIIKFDSGSLDHVQRQQN